jgi:hypothetical protein
MFVDTIQCAIAEAVIAEAAKLRLQPCLKWLVEALANVAPLDALVIAAATPHGALVFAAETWPRVDHDAPFDQTRTALAMHAAIEGGTEHSVILHGLTRLLGRSGLAAAAHDAGLIAARGEFPIIVLLSEHANNHVTSVVTVAALERRVLH